MKLFPAMFTPVTPNSIALARRPARFVAAHFGRSFKLSDSYTAPPSSARKSWTSDYKLVFTVCPNGGRNVRSC
jgi:hypothetical protein